MFSENEEHKQENLMSTVKQMPANARKLLKENWSSVFYEEMFCNIDEERFEVLYSDKKSRPNKPVNELVSLMIIQEVFDLTDEKLKEGYHFDLRINNALGKENLGMDTLSLKTIYNFRQRILEHQKETGINLLKEVFKDFRDDLMEEFDIDGKEQRMDSTSIEANIKNLTRVNLFVKVLHNFIQELPDEELERLPEEIRSFEDEKNLDLSYRLKREAAEEKREELAEHLLWIREHYKDDPDYNAQKSYEHICRVLDEQCYVIPELVDEHDPGEDDEDEDEEEEPMGWEPVRKPSSNKEESPDQDDDVPEEKSKDEDDESGGQKDVKLKDPEDIHSGSLQNPHDEDATYQKKNGKEHHGYKGNICETCVEDNPFQIITEIDVDTNNTEDAKMLEDSVEDLSEETGLEDLLNDGAYSGKDVEKECEKNNVTQHFSGIKGPSIDDKENLLARADFEDNKMISCPEGHEPYVQEYDTENQRYWGRFKKEVCGDCELKDECFVTERQKFYSYGFYQRKLVVSRRREKLKDPEYKKFLHKRAGVESTVNQMYCKSGKRTKYTGLKRVKNSNITRGVGVNFKRLFEYLQNEGENEKDSMTSRKTKKKRLFSHRFYENVIAFSKKSDFVPLALSR